MPTIYIDNIVATGFDPNDSVSSVFIDESGNISSLNSTDPGAEIVVDGAGAYLCPGWMDSHAHIWYGGTDLGVTMAEAGAARGVTHILDAGSAGDGTLHGFRKFIAEPAQLDGQSIFAFLNIGSSGLAASKNMTELPDYNALNLENLVKVAQENSDLVFGLKARASAVIMHEWGLTPIYVAKKLSRILNLPLMCHVGEPPPNIEQVVDLLEAGDIVTHTYNGKVGGSLTEDPAVEAALKNARTRGVYLDIGHGAASFSFDVFSYAIANGLKPDSISTDIHARNVDGAVLDMATTMAKTLELGMSFDEVIAASTLNPRAMLGQPTQNLLQVGAHADFTIFDLTPSSEIVFDSLGAELTLTQMFEPRWSIMGNNVVAASRNIPGADQRTIISVSPLIDCC